MHTELWFPSVIWSSIIHVIDNKSLKDWCYYRKKNDIGRIVSNYSGYQSSDILAGDNEQVDKLITYTNHEISQCARQVGLPELEIQNIWININPQGAYNHLHCHAGSVLSGVYYIDASDKQGAIQFERTDNADYFIPRVPEKVTYFSATRATYQPKTGTLLIFPSWLKHSVEGNKTSNDRISISFNYGLKNKDLQ